MVRSRRLARSSLATLLCAAAALAAELPAGTELPIRLKTKVSTLSSRAGDPVEAAVIGGALAGATARGTVEKVAQSAKGDERSLLVLRFDELELGGSKTAVTAQVAKQSAALAPEVTNAASAPVNSARRRPTAACSS